MQKLSCNNFKKNNYIYKGEFMDITRPTYMEINLDNLDYNIEQIRKKVGSNVEIMPVIKANGYGTYINKRKDVLDKFNIVAVATVDEAIDIRKTGFTASELALELMKKGIIVRDCTSFKGLDEYWIRISICTLDEDKKFIEIIKEVLN